MSVSTFHNAHELLHAEKGENAGQGPQADADIVGTAAFAVAVAVGMRVGVILAAAVRVRRNGVRNEMKKGVAEKTAGSEGQQDVEERLGRGEGTVSYEGISVRDTDGLRLIQRSRERNRRKDRRREIVLIEKWGPTGECSG